MRIDFRVDWMRFTAGRPARRAEGAFRVEADGHVAA
jgi:hypothetical protein